MKPAVAGALELALRVFSFLVDFTIDELLSEDQPKITSNSSAAKIQCHPVRHNTLTGQLSKAPY
jgi:hypothetical protein